MLFQGSSRRFEPSGFKREHWQTASPIRDIFKAAFINAGLAYFNPHSFRNTLVGVGEKLCPNPEAFKAWSQNLGHEGVLTTFYSYGEVQPQRQAEIIHDLQSPHEKDDLNADKIAEAVFRKMNAQNVKSDDLS